MFILGISGYDHNSAAALIQDGQMIAAAEEERFSRKKYDSALPTQAIDFCLSRAGISGKDLDYIGFYEKPLLKFERILSTYLTTFPRGFRSYMKALPVWLREELWISQQLRKNLNYEGPLIFSERLMSHAASAFFVSPFNEAAILAVDGVGEWETTMLGVGKGNEINPLKSLQFPHSLGLLYSAFADYLGFKDVGSEHKVMGLAAFGKPLYREPILKELLSFKEDGSLEVNTKYFSFEGSRISANSAFPDLLGSPSRIPEDELTQFHKDVAASIQIITEEVLVHMAEYLHSQTKLKTLCVAGEIALNCASNSRIRSSTPFEEIFVQPAAGNAGGAVGVAYYIYHSLLKKDRDYVWAANFLGPEYSDEETEEILKEAGLVFRKLDRISLLGETARLLDEQKVVGWFQGRMEFGSRALGNRSILADPRSPEMQSRLNTKVKFRENFSPFAPSAIRERAGEYFEFDCDARFMQFVAQVKSDHRVIPAVTHVDGSARIQTVSREDNPLFYDLLKEFEGRTRCPILLNTSFNVRGEPMVCNPHQALRCFFRTDIDNLVIGSFMLDKARIRNAVDQLKWEQVIALDET